MPQIHKDRSSDAFIAKDNLVVLYRDHVSDYFGLKDPIVVDVVNDGPEGVFNSVAGRSDSCAAGERY